MEDHLSARFSAPGFKEAEVTGGDVAVQREVELADAAALAPFTE